MSLLVAPNPFIHDIEKWQTQPSRGVLRKRSSENMQQIHTSAWVFSWKFAAYFQNTFPTNTSGGLLLKWSGFKILAVQTLWPFFNSLCMKEFRWLIYRFCKRYRHFHFPTCHNLLGIERDIRVL